MLFTLAMFEHGILTQNLSFADNRLTFKAYTAVTQLNNGLRELSLEVEMVYIRLIVSLFRK